MHAGPLTDCLNPNRLTRMPDGSMALGTPVADLRSNVRMRGFGAAVVSTSLGAIRNFEAVKNDLTDYDKAATANLQREVPLMSAPILAATLKATTAAYAALGRTLPIGIKSLFAAEIAKRKAQGAWPTDPTNPYPTPDPPCIGCSPNSPPPPDPNLGAGDSEASVLDTLPTWAKIGIGVAVAGAVGFVAYSIAK